MENGHFMEYVARKRYIPELGAKTCCPLDIFFGDTMRISDRGRTRRSVGMRQVITDLGTYRAINMPE